MISAAGMGLGLFSGVLARIFQIAVSRVWYASLGERDTVIFSLP